MLFLGDKTIIAVKKGERDVAVYKGDVPLFPVIPPPPIQGILEQIKQSVQFGDAYYVDADGEQELVVKFTDVSNIGTLTVPDSEELPNLECDYLVVAGGGSGGSSYLDNKRTGGGGAGGLAASTISAGLVEAGEWTFDVGAGGTDANGQSSTMNCPLSTYFTEGGGRGGWWSTEPGAMGGSGGGGSYYSAGGGNYAGQGHQGGSGAGDAGGGGGGGAGSDGRGGADSSKGQGGDGIQSSIDGELKWYAAGGSGGASDVSVNGIGGKGQADVMGSCTQGADGTGSGGGAGYNAGRGGHGIIIARFRLSNPT